MNIDVHAHFISRNCLAASSDKNKPYMPALSTDKNGREIMVFDGQKRTDKYFGLESRLKDMDAMAVDMQVLSLIPNLLYYELKAEDFLLFCQHQN